MLKRKLTSGLAAAVLTGVLCSLSAAAASPVTGERSSPVPYVLMGIGLAALVAVLVLTMVGKKKKDGSPTPPADSYEPRQNDDQGPGDPQP